MFRLKANSTINQMREYFCNKTVSKTHTDYINNAKLRLFRDKYWQKKCVEILFRY